MRTTRRPPRSPRLSSPRTTPPPPNSVPVVGLTGGIGAGKSTALAALARLGAAVLSTDSVVHELYSSSSAVRDAVVERFGPDVAPGGAVDRAVLAERAFGTPEDRAWLERLIWPLVGERIAAWRRELVASDEPPRALVIEIPLLFEAGMEGDFDATIAVVADEPVRDARARARGHRALDERAARQFGQDEKAARATFVVVNDGTVAELQQRLAVILESL